MRDDESLPPLDVDDPTTDAEKNTILRNAIDEAAQNDPTRFTTRSFAVLWNEGHSMRLINRDDPRKAISIPWDELSALRALLGGTRSPTCRCPDLHDAGCDCVTRTSVKRMNVAEHVAATSPTPETPVGGDSSHTQVVQAITDIQEARESHVQWAAHLRDTKREECKGCDDHAAHIGDAAYHDEWIAKYDNAIYVLAHAPFAGSAPGAGTGGGEGEESLIEFLLSWRKWYSEDLFSPWTIEEANRVHAEFPGAVDRISADSARRTIDNIIVDIKAGKHRSVEK